MFVEDWATANAGMVMDHVPGHDKELARFGLGEAPARVQALLDGRRTLAELGQRIKTPEARGNFLRLLYLLVHTDLAVTRG